MKGKDMILSDFLSQQKNDDSDPSEIIPISFNAYRILEENRKIDVCKNEEKFLIQMYSQAKIQNQNQNQIQNPKRLEDIIDMGNLIHKFLPRQTDIDKILHIIQRKVLKGTHLPVEVKEIQAGYLHSPYFKEIYQYLLLEVHRVGKELNPNLRPEKQHPIPKKGMTERPHIGQGRAGLRRKHKPDHIDQPLDVTRRISERSKVSTGKTNIPQHTNAAHDRGINNDKSFLPDVLLHLDPLHKPLLKQQNIDKVIPANQSISINLDIEENSPLQEGIISETIQRPDKTFFQNPKRLEDIIDMGNLIHKFLPRQTDIDKILHIIQRKVLKGTHLPVEVKEIQVGYLHSPYFKEIYQYLSQNKLPHSKLAIKKLEALSERYILPDSVLFRIHPDKETAVLAIPETCADKIITPLPQKPVCRSSRGN